MWLNRVCVIRGSGCACGVVGIDVSGSASLEHGCDS